MFGFLQRDLIRKDFAKLNHKNHIKDYGYYGKEVTGYTHYKQDFDKNFEHNGGGGNNGGCLWAFFGPTLFLALWAELLIAAILLIYFFFIVIPDAAVSAFSGMLRITSSIIFFNL